MLNNYSVTWYMRKEVKNISYKKDWWNDSGGFFGKLYAEADDSFEGFLKKPEVMSSRIKKEVEGVIRLCKIKKNAAVLDCPCGYGRHSLGLSQKGYRVHGVDINSEHLSLARKQANKISKKNHRFTHKDMRTLSFKEKFDAVINMFYSFGFFDDEADDQLSVENFYRALKPGGAFLMHTFITIPKIKAGDYKKHDIRSLASGNKLELFRDFNVRTKREVGEWAIVYPDGTREILAPYSMRIYSNEEFDALCRRAGFKDVVFYGDWNGTPYKPHSELLIAVARK
jgi:SAM-dependent methyltransferase